jgi:hypothetical protein
MTEENRKSETGFVVAKEFSDGKGGKAVNYFQSGVMGFNTWGSDPAKAKHFDTRALAKRQAQGICREAYVVLHDPRAS